MTGRIVTGEEAKTRVSYVAAGLWIWECAKPHCPGVDFAASAARAGDDAREHMRNHVEVTA